MSCSLHDAVVKSQSYLAEGKMRVGDMESQKDPGTDFCLKLSPL